MRTKIIFILFNYLFYIYYKRELNGINNLLNSLEINQLPNEKEFLEKRKIINVDTAPVEPAGWFLTIVYEMEVRL